MILSMLGANESLTTDDFANMDSNDRLFVRLNNVIDHIDTLLNNFGIVYHVLMLLVVF